MSSAPIETQNSEPFASHLGGVVSTADDVNFVPLMKSTDGVLQSYARFLPSPPGLSDIQLAVWKAEPGEYRSNGSESIETFVVTHGRGKIVIDGGGGDFELEPGVIVNIPSKTVSTITVYEALRKLTTLARAAK